MYDFCMYNLVLSCFHSLGGATLFCIIDENEADRCARKRTLRKYAKPHANHTNQLWRFKGASMIQQSGLRFYRAMLCIARTLPSQDDRLSVHLSVTRRFSIEIAKRIIKLFFTIGSTPF